MRRPGANPAPYTELDVRKLQRCFCNAVSLSSFGGEGEALAQRSGEAYKVQSGRALAGTTKRRERLMMEMRIPKAQNDPRSCWFRISPHFRLLGLFRV